MNNRIQKELKAAILANLTLLDDVVDFTDIDDQVVRLTSDYYDRYTKNEYTLCIDCIVAMECKNGKFAIASFKINDVYFFVNDGQNPNFVFTRTELNNYIDFK